METPEQREQREAEEEEKTRRRVRKRLYADLAKKGMTREEVDKGLLRLEELMERGSR